MKLVTLRLLAFGPFTNLELDLSRGTTGFQLLYGPNEAGKTSALRAVRQLLYGMDRQSKDAFLHTMSSLRLGALLERRDGRTLEFIRRKADKNSLREADDQTVLAEDALDDWLAGVDEPTFQSMFGIDHARLREGGVELERGKGRLAETLFAAAAGVAHLRRVAEELTDGAQELYKPSGKNQRVPELLRELKKAQKDLHDLQLPSEQWRTRDAEFKEKQQRRDQLAQRLLEWGAQHARWTRCQTALPVVARWRQVQAELAGLQDAPLLRDDFAADVARSLKQFELQAQLAETAKTELARLEQELQSFANGDTLLNEADTIDELKERLGSYRKAQSDRPDLLAKAEQAEQRVQYLLTQLGRSSDDVEALRLSPDRRVRLQELGTKQQMLTERVESRRAEQTRLQRKLEQARQQLRNTPQPPPTGALRQVVARIRQLGDIEAEVARLHESQTQQQQALAARVRRLAHWNGTLEDLAGLATPSVETVDRLEHEWNSLDERRRDEQAERQRLSQGLTTLAERLRQLEAQGSVSTPAEVQSARDARDSLWDAVRLRWSTREPFDEPLAASLSTALRQADALADQLQRAADRVALKTELLGQQARDQQAVEELDRVRQAIDRDQAAWNETWHSAWQALPTAPASPPEMRRWLQERDEILAALEDGRALHSQWTAKDRQLTLARQELAAVSGSPPNPAATLQLELAHCEAQLQGLEQTAHSREQLAKAVHQGELDVAEAQAAVEQSTTDLDRWQTEWTAAITGLGVAATASSAEVFAVLQTIDRVFTHREEAHAYRVRLVGIERDAEQFIGDVGEVCARLLPTPMKAAVVEQVAALTDALKTARSAYDQQQALAKQRQQQRKALEKCSAAHAEAKTALQALCHEAGCANQSELPALIPRAERRRELLADVRQLEEQLAPLTGNATLAAFLAEIEAVDPDLIPHQLRELESQQSASSGELSTLDQAIGSLRAELQQMQGGGDAAEQANLCQTLIADLQDTVRRYAVLRLSAAVLQRGIERYRDRHQGPLLSRASHLFARMSLGSFGALRSDVDDKGVPILVGVRPDGRTLIGVDGMSDGARDQLYLSLRLAGLEAWLDHHEPLPFIVDDLLLHFDDDRAAATLEVLGELSRRTQVLFFSHHRRLVELAEATIPAELLAVHHLKPAAR
jgi:uncharacterized protein YhaN